MIAFLWMFLNNDWAASGFIVGYVLGILVLFGLRRFFDGRLYLGKGWAIIKLAALLLRELVVSSYIVVKAVLRPDLDIRPAILMYTTELKSDWEVAVLITLLCLTPARLCWRFPRTTVPCTFMQWTLRMQSSSETTSATRSNARFWRCPAHDSLYTHAVCFDYGYLHRHLCLEAGQGTVTA